MKKLNVYRILLLLLLGSNLLLLLNGNSNYNNDEYIHTLRSSKIYTDVINNNLHKTSAIITCGLIVEINDTTLFEITNLGMFIKKPDTLIYIQSFDKFQ